MLNPFVNRMGENRWVLPVSLLALVVGFMAAVAALSQESRAGRVAMLADDQRQRFNMGTLDLSEENEKLNTEVASLRAEVTRLQNAVATNSTAATELNDSLQLLKTFAGLTEVEGPGVTVTLRDSQAPASDAMDLSGQIVHDTDVLRVVNELRNAGAEAVAINNKRVGMGTNVRCVGTTVLVDETRVAPPIVIRAIGDPETLFGGINLPGGILSELKAVDPQMAEVSIVRMMRLPAFSGATQFKVAKTVTPKAPKP
jgi:uncharacterized protein YlxW (UPF0749 family)